MLDWLLSWQNSNKTKMASNSAIKYFYVDFTQKECLTSKVYFSNKIVYLVTFKWPLITLGFSVTLFYPICLYPTKRLVDWQGQGAMVTPL